MYALTRLSDAVLDRPLTGYRVDGTLRNRSADGALLLVFLRHFG